MLHLTLSACRNVNAWNSLPEYVVHSPSLSSYNRFIDKIFCWILIKHSGSSLCNFRATLIHEVMQAVMHLTGFCILAGSYNNDYKR